MDKGTRRKNSLTQILIALYILNHTHQNLSWGFANIFFLRGRITKDSNYFVFFSWLAFADLFSKSPIWTVFCSVYIIQILFSLKTVRWYMFFWHKPVTFAKFSSSKATSGLSVIQAKEKATWVLSKNYPINNIRPAHILFAER